MCLRLMLGCGLFFGWTLATAPAQESKKQQDPHGHQHGHEGHDHGHEGHDHAHGQEQGQDATAEMMDAYLKMSEPGPEHRALEPMIGEWSYVSRFRMSPEQEWTESKGTATTRWIMDGRYALHETQGVMWSNTPFKGMGITGYDKMKNKYVNAWIDNMTTGIMLTEGTGDPSGKTFTYEGKMDDPMSGQKDVAYKYIFKVASNSEYVMEWYSPGPDGAMFKTMEIQYTRK